jgi:hypothetical protein
MDHIQTVEVGLVLRATPHKPGREYDLARELQQQADRGTDPRLVIASADKTHLVPSEQNSLLLALAIQRLLKQGVAIGFILLKPPAETPDAAIVPFSDYKKDRRVIEHLRTVAGLIGAATPVWVN